MSEAMIAALPWKADEELAVGSGQPTLGSKLGIETAENPDAVVKKKGLKAYEAMERKDAHYASVLQTRKLSLLGKGYEIQPASEDPRDVEIADFVRWNFEHMRGSFRQDLIEILDALGKGFSLSEIVYTLAERGPYKGKVLLKALKAKDQQYFGFALDDFDNILDDGIVQNSLISHGLRLSSVLSDKQLTTLASSQRDSANRKLPRLKFIHFAFNSRAENPYGRGLAGVCYWYSWFKTEGGFKFWLVFLEKFGSPTVTVSVSKEASDPDRKKVKTILKALQQETGIVLPEGFELKLLEAARHGDAGYDRLIEVCNAEISKAVLGQTLTTEQGRRGARSLGQVHQEVLHNLLQFDGEALEATINEQAVERLVDFNYADVEDYPAFRIPLKPRREIVPFTQSLEGLVRMGTRIPERYVHDELDIPVPADDEPVLQLTATATPGGPAEPFAERRITRTELEPPAFKQRKTEAQDALIEAGVAHGRHAVDDILIQLIAQVRRADAVASRSYRPGLSLNIQPLRTALVNTAVLAQLTGRQLAVEELADKGVHFAPERLDAFQEADLPEIVGPKEAIELFRQRVPITKAEYNRLVFELRQKYFTISGIEEANLLKLAHEALIEAIENGGTVDTFTQALRERAVSYTGRDVGQDLAGAAPKEAQMLLIFRQNVMSAYNQGRDAIFNDPDVRDFIPYLMYSAIVDGRERPSHREMDGRIYRRDDPIWLTWSPPNGYNCRCHKIPVTQEEARRLNPEAIVTGPAVLGGAAVHPDTGFGGFV